MIEDSTNDISTFEGEDVFAWLESLAQKQGADEETLITKPEDRTDTPPDWLVEASAQKDIDQPEIPETENAIEDIEENDFEQKLPAQMEPDSTFEDTQETVTQQIKTVARDDEPPQEDIESNKSGISALFEVSEVFNEAEENTEESQVADDTIPDWLDGIESEIPASPLRDLTSEPVEERASEEQPSQTTDTLPEGLEQLVDQDFNVIERFESVEDVLDLEEQTPPDLETVPEIDVSEFEQISDTEKLESIESTESIESVESIES